MSLWTKLKQNDKLMLNPRALMREIMGRLRLLWTAKSGLRSIDLRGAQFCCELGVDRTYRKMFTGCYQPELLGVLERYLRDGDTFFDIGANIGFISAYAAGLVGKRGQVHSFEPVKKYFDKLKSMAENNSDFNIFVNNVAVGENTKQVEICVDEDNMGGSSIVHNRVVHISQKLIVKSVTLDDYVIQKNIKKIRLIKIDTEGFEYYVLNGFRSTLLSNSTSRPIIICEIAPTVYRPHLLGFGLDLFKELVNDISYQIFDLSPLRLKLNIEKIGIASRDVLLWPKELV